LFDVDGVQSMGLAQAGRERPIVLEDLDVGQSTKRLDQIVGLVVPADTLHAIGDRLRRLDEQHLGAVVEAISRGAEIGESRRLETRSLQWRQASADQQPGGGGEIEVRHGRSSSWSCSGTDWVLVENRGNIICVS